MKRSHCSREPLSKLAPLVVGILITLAALVLAWVGYEQSKPSTVTPPARGEGQEPSQQGSKAAVPDVKSGRLASAAGHSSGPHHGATAEDRGQSLLRASALLCSAWSGGAPPPR